MPERTTATRHRLGSATGRPLMHEPGTARPRSLWATSPLAWASGHGGRCSMSDSGSARQRVRTAVIWDALRAALGGSVADLGRDELDILDVGGGTGRFAVPLAQLGHRVAV